MKTTHRFGTSVVFAATAALLLAVSLSGCRPGPGPGEETDLRGTWTATDTVTVFGTTLVTDLGLSITDTAVTLTAVTSAADTVVHRLTATSSYTVTDETITFSYTGGLQSEDLGDGTFDVDTMVDLTEADLADLAVDFGGVRGYSLAQDTLVVDPDTAAELQFTREPE